MQLAKPKFIDTYVQLTLAESRLGIYWPKLGSVSSAYTKLFTKPIKRVEEEFNLQSPSCSRYRQYTKQSQQILKNEASFRQENYNAVL